MLADSASTDAGALDHPCDQIRREELSRELYLLRVRERGAKHLCYAVGRYTVDGAERPERLRV